MIDFRYHLVSLISVFLALAVGIILGAGPLQGAIGDQLQGQVDELRGQRNDLRSQLDSANATIADADDYIAAAGPQLIAGTLSGHKVAIIDMDATESSRDKALNDEFVQAGATVVARVQLSDAWTASASERDRKTVAGGLTDLMPPAETQGTPEEQLAQALVTALTQESTVTPGTLSDNATQLSDQLEQFNLIKSETDQTVPADIILLVSGETAAPNDAATPSPATAAPGDSVVAIQKTLAVTAQEGSEAAVVAGPTAKSGDLISAIRGDQDAASKLSTVSGIEAEPGMISVPLAFAARLTGEVGQYGFEDSATAVLPSVPGVDATASPSPSASNGG